MLVRKDFNYFNIIVRNVEYSILPVMSELSTERCDRALGLWLQVHGRRVSTESCRGGAVADGLCSRDRSSGRAAAMASTPGSKVQAMTEDGFLGLRHKTKQAYGSRRRQVVEARASVSGLTEATGV